MFNIIKKLDNNPVYLKELIQEKSRTSKRKYPIPAFLGYFTILVLPVLIVYVTGKVCGINPAPLDMQNTFIGTVILQCLYFCYRAAVHSMPLFAKEKELKTFQNLLSTGLSPFEIFAGKFWFVFRSLALELTVLLPLFIFIGFKMRIAVPYLLILYAYSIIFVIIITFLGLYQSLESENTTKARNKTFNILGAITVGSILLLFILFGIALYTSNFLGNNDIFILPSIAAFVVTLVNPLVNIMGVIIAIKENVLPGQMVVPFLLYFLFSFLGYLMTGVLLFQKCLNRLREVPER